MLILSILLVLYRSRITGSSCLLKSFLDALLSSQVYSNSFYRFFMTSLFGDSLSEALNAIHDYRSEVPAYQSRYLELLAVAADIIVCLFY